jgi:thiamine-phosphate pyrophosphorylase
LGPYTQSTGFHSLEELQQDWQCLDYAFLSPIFDSISKKGYLSGSFDPQEVKLALAAAPMPVYALGGVTGQRVPLLKDMGFAGFGVIGTVWDNPKPLQALQGLLLQCGS